MRGKMPNCKLCRKNPALKKSYLGLCKKCGKKKMGSIYGVPIIINEFEDRLKNEIKDIFNGKE